MSDPKRSAAGTLGHARSSNPTLERIYEDEALALRRSGLSYAAISRQQNVNGDRARNRVTRAQRRIELGGTVTCKTCGRPL